MAGAEKFAWPAAGLQTELLKRPYGSALRPLAIDTMYDAAVHNEPTQ
jgi:hypothetical protein